MSFKISEKEINYSRSIISEEINKWIKEGKTPAEINNGSCFDFAEDVARNNPGRFASVGLGDFMLYRGKWADEPYGFDEALLFHEWPNYSPLHGHSWKEMFNWAVFNWPGIHAWAHCRVTGLCFDVETPEGVFNPFNLAYFKPYWERMIHLKKEGAEYIKDEIIIRRTSMDEDALIQEGWKKLN